MTKFLQEIAERERDFYAMDDYETSCNLDRDLALITGQSVSTIQRNRDRYNSYERDPFRDTNLMVFGY